MTQSRTIRVMIVDDHDMLRSGLAIFIQTQAQLELVGEASSGSGALTQCGQVQPDVILMDLVMPDMDGVSTIQQIRKQYPHVKIIALSSYVDESLVQTALRAGAISYLLKNVSIDALAAAIRDAFEGKTTLAPEATQALVSAAQRPPRPSFNLTDREREVLRLMVRGMSNLEIAAQLMIGVSTVKKHVSHILGKLKTTSRTEAVATAMRYRLVDY